MPRVAPKLELSTEDRAHLDAIVAAPTSEQRQVVRAKVLLLASEGRENKEIAKRLGLARRTVGTWRTRAVTEGIGDLKDRPRSGRRRMYDAVEEAVIIAKTLEKPAGRTHWSAERLAKEVAASASTVLRVWRRNGLQPHRSETFKFSTDPLLAEKVVDIVGLYLNPPEGALVLCVDEKSQIQALERSQPLLPMRPDSAERRTHDYRRHGTTTLFAAINIATAEVLGTCMQRHRHQEFLRFLRLLNRTYPHGEIHLVMDNYATHKHAKIETWFERHPRFVRHFTPTSASWMNQVETWFGILTSQAIRRGSFSSTDALMKAIHRFIRAWNDGGQPFVWVKTAEQILAKAIRTDKSDVRH